MANILLLEDELTLAMHYREWLESCKHTVFHDVQTEMAILTLEEERIDLIVADIILRNADGTPSSSGGLTLISHATLKVKPAPKILAITGTDPELYLLKHAEVMRANGALHKPFSKEQLLSEVDRILASPAVGK